MGHPVGGLTDGEETRVLSIYTFISTNPSAISLLLCVFLIKHLDEITNWWLGRH